MVKVITIMDDVYAELYKRKRSKGMSFSEILRHLLSEKGEEKSSIIELAGSLNEEDINHRVVEKVKRGTYNQWRS
ncbi:antitoxin VapB family protein [Candidatus Micrarchaeota archaeon]|nr:antitoxin VapB family protein [Candidatus Micrarchaeota archaeon]